MTLAQLSAANSATQIKALERGLPAKALHECASLVGMSPSRLARLLGCTRKPRGRYRLYTSEQLLRLARLRREYGRLFGEQALAKMQEPVPGFGGASALELAVTEAGYHAVREFMTGAALTHPVDEAQWAECMREALSHTRGQRPVTELNLLVARLAAAPDQASGDAIRQQILDGFYGTKKPAV